jgi:hypothetical protein
VRASARRRRHHPTSAACGACCTGASGGGCSKGAGERRPQGWRLLSGPAPGAPHGLRQTQPQSRSAGCGRARDRSKRSWAGLGWGWARSGKAFLFPFFSDALQLGSFVRDTETGSTSKAGFLAACWRQAFDFVAALRYNHRMPGRCEADVLYPTSKRCLQFRGSGEHPRAPPKVRRSPWRLRNRSQRFCRRRLVCCSGAWDKFGG